MLGLLIRVIKNLVMSWIMPSLALLMHIVLSMTACSYMIIFNMCLEISVTGQRQKFQKGIIVSGLAISIV